MKYFLFPYLKYKEVNVYIDGQNQLYLVSTGKSKKYGVAEIDYINKLESGFTDNDLKEKLMDSFSKCYSIESTDTKANETVMGRLMGYKSYTRAVKGLKLVGILWSYRKGYKIVPTEKIQGQGFVHLSELIIESNDETLVRSVREGIELACISSE
ncbi:hypothetical protein [Paenibacillus sp. BC26]|uniref:hypothetical protein n=1 Tax=Paenibacillus sp. BC26 TaxID=1881032 RepID=UPI0011600CBE|nr:hypothetical protein [Paenibacillus sp. BC26]